jgi:phospholipid transport system substrate-binding protein
MKKIIVTILVLLFASSVYAAEQKTAMASVQMPIQQGIDLLRNPEYKDISKREIQRDKIWDIVRQAFDFTEVAMRALAQDWKNFNAEQRKEFTDVFADLLKNTYIDKLQSEFQDETVQFLTEEKISDDKRVVKTKVIRNGKIEIPMDYSMRLKEGQWKVYDVIVEGVSLVKNYRTQFKDILSRETPDQLITRLKEKVTKQDKDRIEKRAKG